MTDELISPEQILFDGGFVATDFAIKGITDNRVLRKAVIVEVFNDPSEWSLRSLQNRFGSAENLNEQEDPFYLDRVSNPGFLNNIPRNACIVRPISQEYDKINSPLVSYPFFSSHLCMPVKPGEQVWIISEIASSVGNLPLWICRVPEPLQVEDVNFTHGDRRDFIFSSPSIVENQENLENVVPGFPNSKNSLRQPMSENTIQGPINTRNPYDKIIELSNAYNNFTPEIVPKLTKRIGDLVLQGSNNTAIILGEDRGSKKIVDLLDSYENVSSNASAEYLSLPNFKGTIDIVAGRGRYFEPPVPTTLDSLSQEPSDTQARSIINIRKNGMSYVENDKNPSANNFGYLPREGDPDLLRDCSRIYISMKTDGDENFGIVSGSFNIPNGFENPIEAINESPFVALKSDEIRIIARKDADHEINGSIRIVKEGKNDEDLGAIVMLPDGTIQVSGTKIFIGRTPVDGGNGTGPGPSESQPYVRYKDLEDLWNFFMDELDKFCDTMLTHTTPGYGNPSPQIIKAITELKNKISLPAAEEDSDITSGGLKESIIRVKSKRIFGE